MAQPANAVTMRTGLVFEWGSNPLPWLPRPVSTKRVAGADFYEMRRQDRGLAYALGLNMSRTAPWEGLTFDVFLRQLREAAVAELMGELHLPEADPMADDVGSPTLKKPKRDLMEGVPEVIEILVEANLDLPSQKIRILSGDGKKGLE